MEDVPQGEKVIDMNWIEVPVPYVCKCGCVVKEFTEEGFNKYNSHCAAHAWMGCDK